MSIISAIVGDCDSIKSNTPFTTWISYNETVKPVIKSFSSSVYPFPLRHSVSKEQAPSVSSFSKSKLL